MYTAKSLRKIIYHMFRIVHSRCGTLERNLSHRLEHRLRKRGRTLTPVGGLYIECYAMSVTLVTFILALRLCLSPSRAARRQSNQQAFTQHAYNRTNRHLKEHLHFRSRSARLDFRSRSAHPFQSACTPTNTVPYKQQHILLPFPSAANLSLYQIARYEAWLNL